MLKKKSAPIKTKKIIIANWKAAPESLVESKKIFSEIKKSKVNTKKVLPIICPPSIFLESLSKNYKGSIFKFGAQNSGDLRGQEQTGELTPLMLKDMKVSYVILGHSERRALGETDEIIKEKLIAVLKNKLTPILCIGEKERDFQGDFLRQIEKQIRNLLSDLPKDVLKKIIFAYEPSWAIGLKGHSIEVHELNQTILFIKKILVNLYDRKSGLNAKVLYGGSVDQDNFKNFLDSDIDGLLIGRASVNPFVFNKILKEI